MRRGDGVVAGVVAAGLVIGCLGLTACSSTTAHTDQSGPAAASLAPGQTTPAGVSETPLSGDLTVFAAASLTETFDRLAATFEQVNPEVNVKPVYDGSSTLVTQLSEGASADVFASADVANMVRATDADAMNGPAVVLAKNAMQIAVAHGNPHGIRGLDDLADPDLLVVLCAPQVPCGAASATLISDAGMKVTPVSEEQNVKAVLTKVSLGEADAGLVYATDVKASGGDVDGVDIANANKAVNTYMIGVPASTTNKAAGQAFIDMVLSDAGQTILAEVGFAPR